MTFCTLLSYNENTRQQRECLKHERKGKGREAEGIPLLLRSCCLGPSPNDERFIQKTIKQDCSQATQVRVKIDTGASTTVFACRVPEQQFWSKLVRMLCDKATCIVQFYFVQRSVGSKHSFQVASLFLLFTVSS